MCLRLKHAIIEIVYNFIYKQLVYAIYFIGTWNQSPRI